jgi:hypothetical protein
MTSGIKIPGGPSCRIDVRHGLIVEISAAGNVDDSHVSYVVNVQKSGYHGGIIDDIGQVKRRADAGAAGVGMLAGKIVHVAYLNRAVPADGLAGQGHGGKSDKINAVGRNLDVGKF